MRDVLKGILLAIWPHLIKLLPKTDTIVRINERIEMLRLYRADIIQWRVKKARQMGAKVGKRCRFYSLNFFSEPYLIEIGNDVIISGEVIFVTHDGGIYLLKNEIPDIRGYYGKIKIGNNCFIGIGAIILPNVEIGNNCIIGAGSVVATSFPDNSVIVGNPAKVAFKTNMYTKMRKNSLYTVRCEEYPFPNPIPDAVKQELLVNHFNNMPPKKSFARRTAKASKS